MKKNDEKPLFKGKSHCGEKKYLMASERDGEFIPGNFYIEGCTRLRRLQPSMVNCGSMSLFIILTFSLFFTLSIASLRNASTLFDISAERENYYKGFYLTETFLNFGVSHSCKNFDSFFDEMTEESFPVKLSFLPENSQKVFGGKGQPGFSNAEVFIDRAFSEGAKQQRILFVVASTEKNGGNISTLRCLLSKKGANSFVVNNFTISNKL